MESVYGTGKRGHSKTRPEDPMMHVSPDIRKKLDPLITHDDPAYHRQGYDLATTLQPDMTVFPKDGDPYTRKPYEGDDYLEDRASAHRKMSGVELEYYLDGLRGDLLPDVKAAQKRLKKIHDAITAAGIGPDGVNLRDPDANRKVKLLADLNHETFRAIDLADEIADEKNEEMGDVYAKLFFDQFGR